MQTNTIHPLIAESLNDEQQSAVIIEDNAVVAAGAGSGKTFTLARRFSHLVIERNIPVERILTLTFTDKAAAEMYGRIYNTLKEIESKAEEGSIVKQRANRAVCGFYKARIQTLDSYCRTIVKKASRRYGITPDFTTDKETAEEAAARDSLPFFLKYRNTEALQGIVLNRKPEEAADALFAHPAVEYTSLARDIKPEEDLQRQCGEICIQWEKAASSLSADIHTIFDASADMPETKKPTKSEENLKALVDSYNPEIEENLPENAQLALFFTQWTPERQKEMEQGIVPFTAFVHRITKLAFSKKGAEAEIIIETRKDVRKKYKEFAAMANFILYYYKIRAIMPLIAEFQTQFAEIKRKSGVLTFTDNAELAVKILKEQLDIRYSEQQLFDAIMIDEFQDDNELQRDLLYYLSEDRAAAANQAQHADNAQPAADQAQPAADQAQPAADQAQSPADQAQSPADQAQSPADQAQFPAAALPLQPRKLFFVGDEKQSIYRFRGADVSVFRSLKNRFNSSVTLSTNYRSHPALIAGFNSLFGGYDYPQTPITADTMPELNLRRSAVFLSQGRVTNGGKLPSFEAEYDYVKASFTDKKTKQPITADNTSRIHFCILPKDKDAPDSDDDVSDQDPNSAAQDTADDGRKNSQMSDVLNPAENEAVFTAQKIRSILDSGSSSGLSYQEKDIAILVRSYTNQYLYEKHLRLNGIHYTCENLVGFFGDAPVNDLYHLLRLIVYPQDIASYAAVLRSPFTRISIQGHDACIADIDPEHFSPFPDYSLKYLHETDVQAYLNARSRYATLREKAQTSSAAQMLSAFWYKEGYRYETMWNMDVSLFGELYDFLYELARRADQKGTGISGLVDTLAEYRDSGDRIDDLDIPIERTGAVRIMSIHKSKGLEFPLVFICGAASKGNNKYGSDLVNYEKTWGLTVNCGSHPLIYDCKTNYFYAKTAILERQMREAELRRLLYVAMTRAEKELYITMSIPGIEIQRKEISADVTEADVEKDVQQQFYTFAGVWSHKRIDKVIKDDAEEDQIAAGSVIPNDTFAGYLLPAAASFSDDTIEFKPVVFEEIPRMTRQDAERAETQQKTMAETQTDAAAVIASAQTFTTPLIFDTHISPSSFISSDEETAAADGNSHSANFPEIDQIVASANGQFGYNDFGTIAHSYAESMFTGLPPSIPSRIKAVLTDRDYSRVVSAAQQMAERFVQSPLGRRAKEARWRKNEYEFKLKTKENGLIITGSIDLVFEDSSNNLVVVDFKTDAAERPEIHAPQLAAYRAAASGFRNIPIENTSCFIYYLRTGNSADITDETASFDIEETAMRAWTQKNQQRSQD